MLYKNLNICNKINGNVQNNLYIKNILGSALFKFIGITISFLFVPLLIEFLNKDNYGLWITITSFLGWFGVLDLGVGNGLRNKLTEALSIGDKDKAKVYVSTAYFYISIIFGIILLVFLITSIYIDWRLLFNTPLLDVNILNWIVVLLFSSFCIQAVLKLILILLTALHKVAYVEAINTGLQVFLFLIIFGLNLYLKGNLITLSIVYSLIPILLFVGVSIYFYASEFNYLKPNFKYANFKEFNDVILLGFKFFFLQIAAIIIYATDNMLIAHFFTSRDVTEYNIPFKYFSILTIAFTIILNPFWGAITASITKNDNTYILNIVSKLIKIWVLILFFGLIMVIISPWFFKIWLNMDIVIPLNLTIICFIYVSIMSWCNLFSNVANAYSKIKLQIIIATILMILNIPICYILIKYFGFGVEAMPLGGIFCMSIGAIIAPIQAYKLINQKATGIWNG